MDGVREYTCLDRIPSLHEVIYTLLFELSVVVLGLHPISIECLRSSGLCPGPIARLGLTGLRYWVSRFPRGHIALSIWRVFFLSVAYPASVAGDCFVLVTTISSIFPVIPSMRPDFMRRIARAVRLSFLTAHAISRTAYQVQYRHPPFEHVLAEMLRQFNTK